MGRDGRQRTGRGNTRGEHRHHAGGRSYKEDGFTWPRHHNDDDDGSDDDDDYAHPGRGGRGDHQSRVHMDTEEVRHERTRSPQCRDVEFWGGRRRAEQEGPQRTMSPPRTYARVNLGAFYPPLLGVEELRSKSQAEVQALFSATADGLKHEMAALLGDK